MLHQIFLAAGLHLWHTMCVGKLTLVGWTLWSAAISKPFGQNLVTGVYINVAIGIQIGHHLAEQIGHHQQRVANYLHGAARCAPVGLFFLACTASCLGSICGLHQLRFSQTVTGCPDGSKVKERPGLLGDQECMRLMINPNRSPKTQICQADPPAMVCCLMGWS